MGSLGGPSGVPGGSLWIPGMSLGSLGFPRGSWKVVGGPRDLPGRPWGVPGRPRGVSGVPPVGDPQEVPRENRAGREAPKTHKVSQGVWGSSRRGHGVILVGWSGSTSEVKMLIHLCVLIICA